MGVAITETNGCSYNVYFGVVVHVFTTVHGHYIVYRDMCTSYSPVSLNLISTHLSMVTTNSL